MPICSLSDFSVIQLHGEEAKSFLHGQVTCDVNKLDDVPFLPGCLCNAKGKMWSTFIAIKNDDSILLVLTKDSAQATLRELNKYGGFAKVTIEDVTDSWQIYGSNESNDSAHSIELTENHFLLISAQPLSAQDSADYTYAHWWKDEILSGRAHLFDATIEEYVPQMLNLQALDYISFNKGCYMGQEMVARMRYLGKNKRALYLATTDINEELAVGSDVAVKLNDNFRNSGKVINSVIFDGTLYAQLVLPKDIELSEVIYAGDEHNIEMTLRALPYTIE
jgi:folate-binding protein YgfZ